jgi:hypothetical protein
MYVSPIPSHQHTNQHCHQSIGADISPTLPRGQRMQQRTDRAVAMYHQCAEDAGGEVQFAKELREWSRLNPRGVKPGRSIKDAELGRLLDDAIAAGIDLVHVLSHMTLKWNPLRCATTLGSPTFLASS